MRNHRDRDSLVALAEWSLARFRSNPHAQWRAKLQPVFGLPIDLNANSQGKVTLLVILLSKPH